MYVGHRKCNASVSTKPFVAIRISLASYNDASDVNTLIEAFARV